MEAAIVVEDAREGEGFVRLAAGEGREGVRHDEVAAVEVNARAVAEAGSGPFLRAVQDGHAVEREICLAVGLHAVGVLVRAIERDVLEDHRAGRHVEHLRPVGRGRRRDGVARAVERERLRYVFRPREVHDVRQKRDRVACACRSKGAGQ